MTTSVMSATENNTIISLQDKRLSILSDLEEFAFYGFPDFDDEQRLNYFASQHVFIFFQALR